MILYLMRHGTAEQISRGDDSERALVPEGQEEVRRVAEYVLGKCDGLDLVVCSPYIRARETAEIVAEVFGGVKIIETEIVVPDADPMEFSVWAMKNLRGVESAFVVSHEPYLGCLLGLFLDGDKNAARPFRKAGVACMELVDGEAKLKWSVHPGAIK